MLVRTVPSPPFLLLLLKRRFFFFSFFLFTFSSSPVYTCDRIPHFRTGLCARRFFPPPFYKRNVCYPWSSFSPPDFFLPHRAGRAAPLLFSCIHGLPYPSFLFPFFFFMRLSPAKALQADGGQGKTFFPPLFLSLPFRQMVT